MTTKQQQFIDSLLKERNYEDSPIIEAYRSGLDLTSTDASTIITLLLASPKKTIEQNNNARIQKQLYYLAGHKKAAKNAAVLKEVYKTIGKHINKMSAYSLTDEQYQAIAHLFQ